jgi:hypothetical protein
MNFTLLVVILIQIIQVNCFTSQINVELGIRSRKGSVAMINTYTPVDLIEPLSKTKSTILVKTGFPQIEETIRSWQSATSVDENQIEEWMKSGRAFWLTPEGTRELHRSEDIEESKKIIHKPSTLKYAADIYKSIQTKEGEILVSAATGVEFEDIQAGIISIKALKKEGQAFANIDDLIADRELVDKGDMIANRISEEYQIGSEVWSRWISKTNEYNRYVMCFQKYIQNMYILII